MRMRMRSHDRTAWTVAMRVTVPRPRVRPATRTWPARCPKRSLPITQNNPLRHLAKTRTHDTKASDAKPRASALPRPRRSTTSTQHPAPNIQRQAPRTTHPAREMPRRVAPNHAEQPFAASRENSNARDKASDAKPQASAPPRPRRSTPNTQHPAPNIQCQPPSTKHPAREMPQKVAPNHAEQPFAASREHIKARRKVSGASQRCKSAM